MLKYDPQVVWTCPFTSIFPYYTMVRQEPGMWMGTFWEETVPAPFALRERVPTHNNLLLVYLPRTISNDQRLEELPSDKLSYVLLPLSVSSIEILNYIHLVCLNHFNASYLAGFYYLLVEKFIFFPKLVDSLNHGLTNIDHFQVNLVCF